MLLIDPAKLESFSERMCLTFPLWAINLLSAWTNESVPRLSNVNMDSSASKASKHCPTTFHIVFLDSHSEWSKHINSAIGKWSAIGASSNLSLGKSAIICSPTLPLSLRHVIHLNMADLTTQLPQITQKPKHLISFKVIPLPL